MIEIPQILSVSWHGIQTVIEHALGKPKSTGRLTDSMPWAESPVSWFFAIFILSNDPCNKVAHMFYVTYNYHKIIEKILVDGKEISMAKIIGRGL